MEDLGQVENKIFEKMVEYRLYKKTPEDKYFSLEIIGEDKNGGKITIVFDRNIRIETSIDMETTIDHCSFTSSANKKVSTFLKTDSVSVGEKGIIFTMCHENPTLTKKEIEKRLGYKINIADE